MEAGQWEVSYNDQIYLENGFLIGRLLRSILKARGMSSDALARIRKIAHISSNENWRIIKDVGEGSYVDYAGTAVLGGNRSACGRPSDHRRAAGVYV